MSSLHVFCSTLETVEWEVAALNEVSENKINIWRTSISHNHSSLHDFINLLHPEELKKASRFLQHEDRQRYIISRGVLRLLLSAALSINPERIAFIHGETGKPSVTNISNSTISFNVSHSGDWVLVAIGKSDVGVDVEKIDPVFEFEDIAMKIFTKEEKEYLQNAVNRVHAFFQLWTRKEALLKATSIGIVDELSNFSCLAGPNTIDSNTIRTNHDWSILSFRVDKDYVGSVAVTPGTAIGFYNFDLCRPASL